MTRAEYRAVYKAAATFVAALRSGDLDRTEAAVDKLVELITGLPVQKQYHPDRPRPAPPAV